MAFLDRMGACSHDEKVEIIGYCLMDNHVHMILYDPESALGTFMQRICTFYARYFNDRYGRTGHVFQHRFASEPIEDERYLLSVVRYVHDNPMKAGVSTREAFRWSSYGDYAFDRGPTFRGFVYSAIGGAARFEDFSAEGDDGVDLARIMRADGQRDLDVARAALGGGDPISVKSLPKPRLDAAVHTLARCGLNLSAISRVTGVSRGVVARVVRHSG